jgi:hypothetical protein
MVRKAKGSNKKKSTTPFQAERSHLFKKQPRSFRIGQHLPPKRDLYRFVRWPRYIRIQRQRSILNKRLKVPPSVAQFSKTLQGNEAKDLFKLLKHYMPESPADKKKRLKAQAESDLKEEKKEKKEKKKKKPASKDELNLNPKRRLERKSPQCYVMELTPLPISCNPRKQNWSPLLMTLILLSWFSGFLLCAESSTFPMLS